jgi:uncharacterized protein (TIGR00725 family)
MSSETANEGCPFSVEAPTPPSMPLKIGVMGGATGLITREQMDRAHLLGRAIAQNGCVLITGGCPGLPLAAACGAKQVGGMVVGISPGLSLDEHVHKYHSPTEFHDVLIYTGSGLMGREVVNIRSSDIVVIVGGRSGTLGELAIAYDEGKLIGVLKGMGGDQRLGCRHPESLCQGDRGGGRLRDRPATADRGVAPRPSHGPPSSDLLLLRGSPSGGGSPPIARHGHGPGVRDGPDPAGCRRRADLREPPLPVLLSRLRRALRR